MMRIRVALAALIPLMPLVAAALDLGTLGPTYPVKEQSLLDMIHQRLAEKERSGEIARLLEQAKSRAVESITHPKPIDGIKAAEVARTFFYDPTFTLESNVLDATGKILFPAGTRKNPLEVVAMSKHLLFFDGRDQRQVKRARELIDHYQGRVKPILIAGSYLDLMKRWRIPVYYDQQGRLTKRFQITQVPAMVSQDGMRLRIDEMVVR